MCKGHWNETRKKLERYLDEIQKDAQTRPHDSEMFCTQESTAKFSSGGNSWKNLLSTYALSINLIFSKTPIKLL